MSNPKRLRVGMFDRRNGDQVRRLTVDEFLTYCRTCSDQPEAVVNNVLAGGEFANPSYCYRTVHPTIVEDVQDLLGMIQKLGIKESEVLAIHGSRFRGPHIQLDWNGIVDLANRMQMVLDLDADAEFTHGQLLIDGVMFLSIKKEPQNATESLRA